MKSSRDATIFIDLSFLSPDEETAIRQVLLRDDHLKRQEIGRVRKLRESVSDRKELKVLTGEWFEDLRSKRYGRQPDISAVVRSSIRWKKSAATKHTLRKKVCHKPNPFLNAVLEDGDENKTHPNVSADPRSIHPALNPEMGREYKDEDFVLEVEAPSGQSSAKNIPLKEQNIVKVTNPIHNASNPGTKSTGNPNHVSRDKPALTPSLGLGPEPVRELKTKEAFTTYVTTNTEPEKKVSLPPALVKDGSFEENWVKISVENKSAESIGPRLTDGNVPEEALEVTSFSETRQASGQNLSDQLAESSKKAAKVEAGKIILSSKHTDVEVKQLQRDQKNELIMMKDSSACKEVSTSQLLPSEPKIGDTLLTVSIQEKESTTKVPTVSCTETIKILQLSSNAKPQMERKNGKVIEATDFKKSPPTDVLTVDIKVEESAGVPLLENTRSAQDISRPKDGGFDQNVLAEMKGDKFEEKVMKNAGARRKEGFDVEFVDSQSADKIASTVSEEMDQKSTVEKIGHAESGLEMADANDSLKGELRKESDILASVYARALRLKLPLAKSPSPDDPEQENAEAVVPSIVIVPSESEGQETTESVNNSTPSSEAQVEVTTPVTPSFTADTWEDEGVDSDDDSSSVSSYGSDLSGRRGFSTSTLSVTERTGSLLSVYSDAGDFGNVTVQGSVEFALMYSPLGEIVIMVEQCQDLAIANPRKQRTDPYVKTYLYPDKRSKRKTTIKKRTVNPVFVESLRYKVKREELHEKTLNLSVWHNDSRGRNVFLGQVDISLKNWDWKHQALTWYNLQPKEKDNQDSQEDYGQLSFSLKYVPPETTGGSKVTAGEIHVWLREARNLRRLKTQGVDSFVKCYMLPDTSKKSRQKTRVVKKSQNPVYNHSMVYEGFRPGEVREACCELTVWDNNKLSNQFLGGVRLSLGTRQSYGKNVDWMDSANGEIEIWENMLARANTWVEADLPLRSSMTPRK